MWALVATVLVNAVGVGFFVGTFLSKQRAQQVLIENLDKLVREMHDWYREHRWMPKMVLENREHINDIRLFCARNHPHFELHMNHDDMEVGHGDG
jgi:hypothetical protein